jgi:hypothetical protein
MGPSGSTPATPASIDCMLFIRATVQEKGYQHHVGCLCHKYILYLYLYLYSGESRGRRHGIDLQLNAASAQHRTYELHRAAPHTQLVTHNLHLLSPGWHTKHSRSRDGRDVIAWGRGATRRRTGAPRGRSRSVERGRQRDIHRRAEAGNEAAMWARGRPQAMRRCCGPLLTTAPRAHHPVVAALTAAGRLEDAWAVSSVPDATRARALRTRRCARAMRACVGACVLARSALLARAHERVRRRRLPRSLGCRTIPRCVRRCASERTVATRWRRGDRGAPIARGRARGAAGRAR